MKVAILGAECTGKTQLVLALAGLLQDAHPNLVCVPEYLRAWCDAHGRTPRADEQAQIAEQQMQSVCAHPASTLVLSDTAPLMTAIYSDLVFGDTSLYAEAIHHQRAFEVTLVAGLDLPWVADGFQRDGRAMRARVDQRLRQVLGHYGIAFSTVYGNGAARSDSAMQAIGYALRKPEAKALSKPASEPGKPANDGQRSRWTWPCEKCSDPECEHRLFSRLRQSA
jgi:nicotinamide riboside kinase